MENPILKRALSSLSAIKQDSTKNFEVINSLESVKGGYTAPLGCSNCKKKQSTIPPPPALS